MTQGRAPNYRLKWAISVAVGRLDTKELPQHSMVRPINLEYVPKHVVEDERWKHYDMENGYVFCYTRWGIFPIKDEALEEV